MTLPVLRFDAAPPREGPSRTLDLLVLDQVRIDAWDRVLFLECGDGWVVEEAWRRMGKGYVCGLSLSPQLIEVAVRLRGVPGRVEFKTWGGDSLPLPDRSFDRVIVCVPWGAYREPATVLGEMARVLRPGGDAYVLEAGVSTAVLRRLLADASLTDVAEHRCETVPQRHNDGAIPVVIRARRRGSS
ncbi:MAG TPA: class I SAM-dependent methyltransferase [Gemmatimonadales bacterium]|nr:class I SAM-dependent methyltransferase [Gemmatimonadales bacterium]